jgi:CrcB protein
LAWIYVGVGAFLGANARYYLGGWAADRFGVTFPHGTLLINVSGSFLLGLLMAYFEPRTVAPNWRLFFTVGMLGGYTTFSSYAYEAMTLLENRSVLLALLYFVGSPLAALIACFLGLVLGRIV